VSGPLGTEDHVRVAREAAGVLVPGGWIVLEVGEGQATAVGEILTHEGFTGIAARPDLAGISRAVRGHLA
jgi:release factor glutamine methyltransferase